MSRNPQAGEDAEDSADSGGSADSKSGTESGDTRDAADSAGSAGSAGSAESEDAADSADSEDAAGSADSEDAADSAGSEGATGSAAAAREAPGAARPKTALQRLLVLAEESCSLLTRPRDATQSALAQGTRALALPPAAAATVGALAIGLPHAHPAHPPYVPLVPLGPVVLGFSNGVLIGGMPAVLNGALGVSPTCCGVSPYYEVFTGSANVLIEGERAVRMLDLTFHCQAAPLSGRHPRLRRTLHGAQQALHGEHKVEDVADFAEQNAAAAGALHGAQDGPAEREAAVEAVTMARTSELAERAQDQLIEAMSRLMGLDPAAPAGTPGVLIEGAANVLIGGMPMPSGSACVRGLLRLLP